MSTINLKLTGPKGLPIIGVKLQNGKVGNVTCEYEAKNTAVQYWTFTPNVVLNDDKYIFIDSENNELELTFDEVFEISMLA